MIPKDLARRYLVADIFIIADASPWHRCRRLGNIRFYSATYRLFNSDTLEPACEDDSQAVIYSNSPDVDLDLVRDLEGLA